MELAPFGIHVVIIEPGSIRTEWSGIAADNLGAISGHGPYAGQATAIAEVLAATDSNPRLSSPPEIIADTVARAVRARRPRTRYAVGAGAKPIILARRILTDRAFDALMRRAFRLDNRSTDNSQPLRA
jgi:NAD(P)-dependent dehydrogenase (short-subunit alcohol dehydrogenase family)